MDVFDSYLPAAERALEDAMDAASIRDGTANGNKQHDRSRHRGPDHRQLGVYGGIRASTTRSGAHRPTTPFVIGGIDAGHLDHDPARCSTYVMTAIARP